MLSADPLPNVRWRIAALLFVATVINYVDRQTLSVLASEITGELGLSNIEYSRVVNAFLICYAGMYMVWGRIIDRWGTRAALAVSMVWWSLATAGHALSRGALGLGAFRALLGMGEAGNFLAAAKAISEWFPPQERGFANGLVNAAASTGAILAPPLIVLIFMQWGWRTAFRRHRGDGVRLAGTVASLVLGSRAAPARDERGAFPDRVGARSRAP